jgi:hypothetical protein
MKRVHRLDIATSDLEGAAATYRRNFGFNVRKSNDSGASVTIGDAEIFLTSIAVAPAADSFEGMTALWLEAEDLDEVVASLKQAGIESAPYRRTDGRRILAIDPRVSNNVPLFIFDRKDDRVLS